MNDKLKLAMLRCRERHAGRVVDSDNNWSDSTCGAEDDELVAKTLMEEVAFARIAIRMAIRNLSSNPNQTQIQNAVRQLTTAIEHLPVAIADTTETVIEEV